jgi:hypothetical protein
LVDGGISQQPNDQRWTIEKLETEGAAEAVGAIGSLLAGFGLDLAGHSQLVERLLVGLSAAEAALDHAEQNLEAWLEVVLGPEILAGQSALPIGRAAFLACDGPTVWADLLLLPDGLPEPFVAAMRAAAPSLAPMPMPGTMAAQPLDSWSIADARRAALNVFDGPLGWAANARPLRLASLKVTKQS